jgi:hypothetical protein
VLSQKTEEYEARKDDFSINLSLCDSKTIPGRDGGSPLTHFLLPAVICARIGPFLVKVPWSVYTQVTAQT